MVAIVTGSGLGLLSGTALGLGQKIQLGNAALGQSGEQVYVNASNGNLLLQDRDQFLSGAGVNSEIFRSYNSQGKLLGDNWQPGAEPVLSLLTGVVNTAGSTIGRVDWDGSTILYTYDADKKSYIAASGTGARATLTFDAAGNSWTYRHGANQVSETYDSALRLSIKSDRDGNSVTYRYNTAGKLAQVTTASGETTYLDYTAGNLTQIRTSYKNAAGAQVTATSTRYAYDSSNRLSKVTVDLSPEDSSIADGNIFTTNYTYDGSSNRIASIAESDGSQVAFTYTLVEGSYRVATITQTSDVGLVRVTKLEYGDTTALGRKDPTERMTMMTDPFGLRMGMIFDGQGRLIQTSGPGNYEGKQYKYDGKGNVITILNSDTPADKFSYDDNGNVISVLDQQGGVTTRTFGASNELLTETVKASDALGGQTATTRYVYSANNHLRFIVGAEGRVTEYRYNASGQKVAEIHYSAALYDTSTLTQGTSPTETQLTAWVTALSDKTQATRTDISYDFRGNIASTTQFGKLTADGSGDATAGNGENTQTTYVYDQSGRLLQRLVGGTKVEQLSYDGLGRLLSSTKSDGTVTLYQYDDSKHQTIVTFSNGLVQTSTYNATGELIALAQSSSGTVLSQVQHYYDADGRLRMDVDALGQKTHYLYNSVGQRVAKIDPDGVLTEYAYANVARHLIRTTIYATALTATQLATLVDGNGRPVDVPGYGTSAYGSSLDSLNLRPATTALDRVTTNFYRASSEYDPNINILDHIVSADGTVTQYCYDDGGRVLSSTVYANRMDLSKPLTLYTPMPAADAANDRTTRYFYDKDGLLQGTLNGEGYLTEYRYNAAGQKVAVIAYATASPGGNTLADLRPASKVGDIGHYYQYDSRGLLRTEVDGEGAVTAYNYDSYGNVAQRLQSSTRIDVSSAMLKGNVDSNGQVVPTVQLDSPDWAAIRTKAMGPGSGDVQQTNYTYDAKGQLTNRSTLMVSAPGTLGSSTSISYDSMGNVISETAGVSDVRTTSRRYDVQGRLTGLLTGEGSAALAALGSSPTAAQVDAIWASYGTRYGYDAAGRLISQTDPSGNTTFTYYNFSGEISHTVNALGEVVQYDYDVFGERSQQTVYGIRLDAATLAKLTGGQLTAALQATFTALNADGSASITSYQYNNAGEIVKQTDAQGVETSYRYNSAGQRISTTINTDKTNAVSGQRTDTISYDRLGQIIAQAKDTGGLNLITQALYDAFGRTVQTTDANGVVRSQDYDRQGNVVVVTDGLGNKAQMTYDALKNLLTSTDKTGHTTNYAYSPFNRDVTVTTPEGIVTVTSMNEFGDIIKITDGRGISNTYQYDKNGKLISATKAVGTDAAATVTSTYDKAGHLIATTDARGIQTTYTYDAANRVLTRLFDTADLKYQTTYSYDAKGQTIGVTDPNGVLTTTQYDKLGQKIVVIVDAGAGKLNLTTSFIYDGTGNQLTVTEGVGSAQPRVIAYGYDKLGRLINKTVDPANLNLLTEYQYDGNGNVVLARQNNEPVPTRYAYDTEGRVIYTVNQNGEVTNTRYDAAGRVVARTAFAQSINLPEGPVSEADIAADIALQPKFMRDRDHVTQYAYDADGRLRYTVNAMSYVTEQVYDKAGNVISTTAYATPIAATVAIESAAIADALNAQTPQSHTADRRTRMFYDAANRLVSSINPLGYLTQNTYDANGNLTNQTQFFNPYTEKADPSTADLLAWANKYYRAWGFEIICTTTTWVYDNANRARFVIDGRGDLTENSYDANGNIVQTIRYAPYRFGNDARDSSYLEWTTTKKPYVPGESVLTYYRYDAAGRATGVTDAMGGVTRYELDALGNVVNTYVASGTVDQTITHAVYDAVGRKIEQTRAWGTSIASTSRYTYNAQGLLTAEYDPRAVELAEQDTEWALAQRKAAGLVDASGNSLKAAALDATQKNALMQRYVKATDYDALGRVTRSWTALDDSGVMTDYDAFGNITSITQDVRTTRFLYDKANKNILQTGIDGAVVQTAYNAFGEPIKVIQYYNAAGEVAIPAASPHDAITLLEYDQAGHLTKSTDAEGYSESYSYGALGKRISYINKSGTLFRYQYDQLGNLRTEYLPINTFNSYVYDDTLGNLTGKTENDNGSNSLSTLYERDKNGHVITIFSNTRVTVTAADGSTSVVTPIQRFTYDARGNQTSVKDANGNISYQYYDALNRKIVDISATGTYTSYVYDSAGNVVTTRVYAVPVTATTPDKMPAAPTDLTGMRETNNVYDASNRLIESRIMNVGTGQFYAEAKDPNNPGRPGMYYIDNESTIVRKWSYDTRGNAISSIDPNGNQVFSFYDVNGKKVLDIDAQGYGTAWIRDLLGNVTEQRQYALRYTDAFTSSSDPQDIIKAWPRSGDDRITQYTWDRNNRLTSETRTGVDYATVDSNGAMTEVKGGNATTSYQYDGEGHLLHKTDANGSQSDFTYDVMGRMSSQMLPQFVDSLNKQVRSTTLFEYDSLNHLTKETLKGATAAEDRVTIYTYGTDGRMASKTDAVGTVTSYGYDVNGNTVQTSFIRVDSNGNKIKDTTRISYDAANREISRGTQSTDPNSSGPNYSFIATTETQYNAFGEVTGRRINGGGLNSEWQQYAQYDNAGRVMRSNFDGGISHLYMYDKNGNATLKMESMTTDLRSAVITTVADLQKLVQEAQLNQTFTRYDARNEVIQIMQPKVSAGAPQITFRPIDIPIDGGKFANTELMIGGTAASNVPVRQPALSGVADIGISGGSVHQEMSATIRRGTVPGRDGPIPDYGTPELTISLPDFSALYGNYSISVEVKYSYVWWWYGWQGTGDTPPYYTDKTLTSPAIGNSPKSVVVKLPTRTQQDLPDGKGLAVTSYTAVVRLTSLSDPTKSIELGTLSALEKDITAGYDPRTPGAAGSIASDGYDKTQVSSWVAEAPIDVAAPIQSQIRFANSTLPNDASSMAYYRPAGSTGAYQALPQSALSTPGSYIVDGQALAEGNYDVVFIAVSNGGDGRPAGTLLRRNEYQVTISHGATGSSITDAGIPLDAAYNNTGFQYGAAGTYIWQAPQSLRAYNLQSATSIVPDGLIVRTRPAGSAAWTYTSGPIGRDAATGAFTIDFGGNTTDLDISLVLYKNGQVIDILSAPAGFSGSQTPALNFSFLQDQKTSITFNPPPDTTYLMIKYDTVIDGVSKTVYKRLDKLSAGTFIWATSDDGLIPDPKQSYTYNIVYTAYDAYGTPLSMSKGTVTLGGDVEPTGGRRVTLTGSERPVVIEFVPNADTNNINGPTPGQPLNLATQINLYYRPSPKNPADYDVPYTLVKLTRNGEGRFLFNTSDYGLPENSEYEYRYDALDASGNVLVERHSYFDTRTRSNPATNTDIIGVITETNKDMTIDRYERYDAFGEVSGERDGRGNWTDLYYNAQGKLIKKQQAEVMITLANGFQKVMRPETLFSYDRTGNLVGLRDANGNLTTQSWNYGTGKVDTNWDAESNSKTSQYDQLGNLRIQVDELKQKTSYDYSQLGQLTGVTRGSGTQASVDTYSYDAAGNRIRVTNALQGVSTTDYDNAGRIIRTVSAAGREVDYQYTWEVNRTSALWVKATGDGNGRVLDKIDTFGRVTWHQDLSGRNTDYTYNWAGLLVSEISSAGKNITYSYYSNGLVRSMNDTGTGTEALYEYDGDGNRTYESYRSLTGSYVYTQAYVSYDSLNRVTSIKDLLYSVSYEYDAVGNRRHMAATYHDYVGNTKQSQDYWYAYDALNRFTLTMGQLSGARAASADDTSVSVVLGARGGDGVYLAYNAVGQRKLATYASDGRTELYGYDALGYLTTQTINGVKTSERINDRLGRVTNYAEWLADGSKQVTNLTKTYDKDGLQTTERDSLNGSTTTYTRLLDGTVSQVNVTPDDKDKGSSITTTYTYERWDGLKQSKVTALGSNPLAPGWKPASSLYNYDVNGNLKAVFDDGGGEAAKQRAFSYETDQQGQVLRRNELGGVIIDANNKITGAVSGRIHNFYYLNGHRIGNVGNDGIEKIDYAQELAGKLDKGSDDTYKIFKPISSVDFDENYMKVSSQYPSMNASSWTVRAGDTLQSIASALWGDSTLWYLLADANGLKSSDEALRAGQLLTVPNVITNLHNTANTFKPYDPGLAIGNTQPTLPTPPPPPANDGACGGFAPMLAFVVAIVATFFAQEYAAQAWGAAFGPAEGAVGGAAAGATTVEVGAGAVGGATIGTGVAGSALSTISAAGVTTSLAVGGAAGSLAGQGVMIALGEQNGINWNSVAMAAVGSAVGSRLPGMSGNAFINGALQGAAGGVLTQGIGVATGLQHGFDWKGIAVSAIAQGISQGVGAKMYGAGYSKMDARLVGGFAGGVASAVARGGSLGRNIGAVTMDAVASTIGNSVVDQMAASSTQKIYGIDDGNTQVGPDFRLAGASNGATGFRSGYSASENMGTDTGQGALGNSRDAGIAIPQRAVQSAINLQTGDSSLQTIEVTENRASVAGSNGQSYTRYGETTVDADGMTIYHAFGHQGAMDQIDESARNFAYGYDQGNNYRSVMDPPITNSEFAGRLAGDSVDSFKRFGLDLIGKTDTDAVRANWNAGNRGTAILYGMRAVGSAGTTILGMGTVSAERAIATQALGDWTVAKATYGANNVVMNSGGDRLIDTMGSARINNAVEYNAIINDLKAKGVDISYREGQFAYGPAPSGGRPGNIVFDPDSSLSAIKHEYGHFLDDAALGFPGQRYYYENPGARMATERGQYLGEIRTARELGDTTARRQLIEDYLGEKKYLIDNYYTKPYGSK